MLLAGVVSALALSACGHTSHSSAPPTAWRQLSFRSYTDSYGPISCFDSKDCLLLASSNSKITSDGGVTWHTERPLPEGAVSLDCTTHGHCVAAGLTRLSVTTNSGKSWTTTKNLARTLDLFSDVSCATVEMCMAVGYAPRDTLAFSSSDGGRHWAPSKVPVQRGIFAVPVGSSLMGVSCPSVSLCVAVGSYGISMDLAALVEITHNFGKSWTQVSVPAAGELDDVTCPTARDCWAVGESYDQIANMVYSTDAGATWSFEQMPDGLDGVDSISCAPATTTCWAGASKSIGPETELGASSTAYVLRSSGPGKPWVSQEHFVNPYYSAAYLGSVEVSNLTATSTRECWMVVTISQGSGFFNSVYLTTDGGELPTTSARKPK